MSSTQSREEKVLQHIAEKRAWYDRNARRTMHWYQNLRVLSLVCTLLVPILVLVGTALTVRIVAASLGAIAAFAQGFEGIHQYREHYITWRYTAEQIEREAYEYTVQIGDYEPDKSQEDPIRLLAEHVEAMTSQENQQWLSIQQKPDATSVAKGGGTS